MLLFSGSNDTEATDAEEISVRDSVCSRNGDECVQNFHHITVFVTLQEGANFDQDIYEDCLSELSNKTIPVISSSSETHEDWN